MQDFSINVRADALDVFNHENVAAYHTWRGDPGVPNVILGTPNAYFQPTRTFKLSLSVDWR